MLMTRARPQDYFVIEGGGPISGRIRPEGNKNAALPLLAGELDRRGLAVRPLGEHLAR